MPLKCGQKRLKIEFEYMECLFKKFANASTKNELRSIYNNYIKYNNFGSLILQGFNISCQY